jgi:hypothetical protein
MIGGHGRQVGKAATEGYIDAINIRQVFVETIIARLKVNVLEDKEAGRHADGQSENIDQRIDSILNQVPVGDLKVVPKHNKQIYPIS